MLSKFLDYYEILVLDHPRKLLAFLGALVLLAAFQIPQLFIETSSDTLVLEGDYDLQYYQEVRKRYPDREFLIISYLPKKGNILEPNNIRNMTALVDELKLLEGVYSVNSILDVPLLEAARDITGSEGRSAFPTLRQGNLNMDAVADEFRNSPLYGGLISNKNLSAAAIQLLLLENKAYQDAFARRETLRREQRMSRLSAAKTTDLERVERIYKQEAMKYQAERNILVKDVRDILERYRSDTDIFLGGVPMITVDMVRFVRSDLVIFALPAGIIILFMLLVIFRDWRWALVPLLCCAMVSLFTMGLLIWIDWTMNIVSANYLLLLFIITLAVNVHLIVCYRELHALSPKADHRALIAKVMRRMITPCSYMVMTTIVSFVSLYFSQVRPVIDFGMMMALTCFILLTWSFLVFPSALVLLSQPKPILSLLDYDKSYTRYYARTVDKLGVGIVWVYILAVAIGIYGISQLKVESRFIDYFAKDTEIYQGMETIDKDLGGTIPFEILLTQSAEKDDIDEDDDFDFGDDGGAQVSPWLSNRGLKIIKQVHDYMESLPASGKVLSLGVLYDIMEGYLGRPPDDVELAVFTSNLPEDVRSVLLDAYLSGGGTETRIALRVKETSRDLERGVYIQKVHDDLQEMLGMLDVPPENIQMTGLLVLYNNLLQSLYKSQVLTLGVVMSVIFLMFMLLFRSAIVAALAVLPNLLAALLILGVMGLIGLPLDMVTVVIAALVVGIGVDDTVHYVWRFKREFAVTGNYAKAMHICHGSVGRAISYTSLVIVLGLILTVLSNFTPTIRFGLLTSLAMVLALMGTMLVLPQVFKMIQPFGPEFDPASAKKST
jgi:predicted RND superfamily exporter protein